MVWTTDRTRSRSPHGGAGPSDEIVRLIMMREQARSQKDWSLADSIRDQLLASGVTLQDKSNSWKSSDGQMGRIPTFAEIEAGATPESFLMGNPGARMAQAPAGDGSEAHVKQLVRAREQARAQKDWAQSDSIRSELKALGVDVFDKEKMWRSKTGASGVVIGYRPGGGVTDLEIQTLIMQREKARQNSDYATSDMIRDELMAVGVQIQDKEKTWRSMDGRAGAVPSWAEIIAGGGATPMGAPGMGAPGMGKGGGGSIQDQLIQAALAAAQDPKSAARTLQMLQQAGGGAACGGKAAAAPAAAAAPTGPVNAECKEALEFVTQCQAAGRPAQDAEIDWLVGLREKFRAAKDFPSSDALRNAMRTALGIRLEEKEKIWKTSDGRTGSIPMWSMIA